MQIDAKKENTSVCISIRHAVKRYENVTVIPDLSLDIQPGEFFTLLGPSGCGKTTLLRMIAGFNTIEGGDFYFGNTRINDKNPANRNIGMVFQNYAIFPNLTVEKNVAFGLEAHKVPKDQIVKDVDEFLDLMQIKEFRNRLPSHLSGGQQQRVALARALVIRPQVLLMDEPLSNLDAKLRIEMREVIKEIQNKLGITTVYVTHDQEEAMAVSDRIAVINHGVIQQIGSARELYQRPRNLFVATFLGRTNILKRDIENGLIKMTDAYSIRIPEFQGNEHDAYISIRPEEFVLHKVEDTIDGITGTVEYSIFLGLNTHYTVKLVSGEIVHVVNESEVKREIKKGESVKLTVNEEKINIFSADGTRNLLRGGVSE